MKITETIERECCDPEKDLKQVDVQNFENCSFCIHCGQWWIKKSTDMKLTASEETCWEKIYPRI
jgi:NADH pyrophosphatase NudC (nudix superfamily)